MTSGGLIAQPLGPGGGFNWVFLVELLVCGILSLFFLFYFNRLFATVVSYALRAYTWHKYRAYIDINSLQISLLGGRIFFKSIRYHGHNETVLVHDGHITWRYWLRTVQEAEVFERRSQSDNPRQSRSSDESSEKSRPAKDGLDKAETGSVKPATQLPCRIHVKVSGVEAFLYNHSPAYDGLLAGVQATNAGQARSERENESQPSSLNEDLAPTESIKSSRLHAEKSKSSDPFSIDHAVLAGEQKHKSLPAALRMLPIQIECRKAAAAVGNENTTSVVVAKLENASGRIDAGEAGQLDLFKLLFMFNFTDVLVSLKPNKDFKAYQLQAAARARGAKQPQSEHKRRHIPGLAIVEQIVSRLQAFSRPRSNRRRGSSGSIRNAPSPTLASSGDGILDRIPGESEWHGLARFLDEGNGIQPEEWEDVEYARFSSIADCKKISMKFYWDIPGQVLATGPRSHTPGNANGCQPPEYGLDLAVQEALINYGPWADRQRIILQQIFFPSSFVDATPVSPVREGQSRLATIFKMHLCLEEKVTLRIPTREPSKDWKWQGRTSSHGKTKPQDEGPQKRRGRHHGRNKRSQQHKQGIGGIDTRPFGWFDITVQPDSVINYTMDMYARSDGYHNDLDLDVTGSEISSSVNHGVLWTAGRLSLIGDLSNPSKWNSLRTWMFKIVCHDLDFYILRDHMFLLTDLITDWSAGPPADYYTFTPFKYLLDVNFINLSLFLNSNDANVINNPTDPEDNSFVVLRGRNLHAEMGIPIERYRPTTNQITFDVLAFDLSLEIRTPPRNTLHSLLHAKQIARLPKLTLTGTHTYFSQQSADLTDILQMDICGSDLSLQLYGFLVRHFVNVKENYFGEFLHFKTLEEFQSGSADPSSAITEEVERHNFRRSNDLDVILLIRVEEPRIMLPGNLYSAENYISADLPLISADLRVTNYYLDLQANVSPVTISYCDKIAGTDSSALDQKLRIESVDISGHRFFGLPPTEPAYVSNWDVDIGAITGEVSPAFMQRLAAAGTTLAFSLDDHENAVPIADTMPVTDITFLRLKAGPVDVWLLAGEGAVGLSVQPIELEFSDRADSLFSSRLSGRLPGLTIACVDSQSHRNNRIKGSEYRSTQCLAFLQTSVDIALMQRKRGFARESQKQQDHVRQQDVRTNRALFLINNETQISKGPTLADNDPAKPAAMVTPLLPPPLHRSTGNLDTLHPNQLDYDNSKATRDTKSGKAMFGPENKSSCGKKGYGPEPPFRQLSNAFNLTSAYALPDFPLSSLEIDFHNVPAFTNPLDDDDESGSDLESVASDTFNPETDEDSTYLICVIKLEPGVRILIKPKLADVALAITSAMLPMQPEDVLDAFQIQVMDSVRDAVQMKRGHASLSELQITVPEVSARLLNEFNGSISGTFRDQIDLNIGYVSTSIRSRTNPESPTAALPLVTYTTIDSISLEVSGQVDKQEEAESVVRIDVDEILVWSKETRVRTLNVSYKILTTLLSGEHAALTISALLRFAAAAHGIQTQALALSDANKKRPRLLVHYVTAHQGIASDPPYLSRMTYVLRAFPDHFRNQDSWKIMARLRHSFDSLDQDSKNDLLQKLVLGTDCPVDNETLFEEWREWCSWDIPQPESTRAFKALSSGPAAAEISTISAPMQLVLQAEVTRLLLGSVDRASEISLAKLVLELNINPPTTPSGLMLVEENLRTLTVVQATTTAVLLNVRWDILELIEPLVQAFEEHIRPMMDSGKETDTVKVQQSETSGRQDFHVLIATNSGSIILNTLNLQQISSSENLKVSVIGTSRAPAKYGKCVSVLVNSEHAITELRGNDSRIWRTDLTVPSICVDYREMLVGNTAELNVGGSYDKLDVRLEQGMLSLLGTVDTIVHNEVMHIRRLQQRFSTPISDVTKVATFNEGSSREIEVNAALLAGTFNFEMAILESLALNVSGSTGNLRVKPRKGPGLSLAIEIDVGPVRYAALSRGMSSEEQAVFQAPPIGISTGLQVLDRAINFSTTGFIQEMTIEAAAIQNVLYLVRRSEVQAVFEAAKDGAKDLQRRVATIFGQHETQQETSLPKEPRTFIYEINVTFAGAKVRAIAPITGPKTVTAELVFGFGRTQALVHNKFASPSDPSILPDVYARVESVYASLVLVDGTKRVPCGHVKVGFTLRSSLPKDPAQTQIREINAESDSLDIEVSAVTASTIVDIVTHIQKKIVDLDLSKEVEYLRRLRHARQQRAKANIAGKFEALDDSTNSLASSALSFTNVHVALNRIRLAWVVTEEAQHHGSQEPHDLELTLLRVEFSTKQQNQARLAIRDLQLQMVAKSQPSFERTLNSALLPEVIFTVLSDSHGEGLKLVFRAAGQALDLRLDSRFVVPLSALVNSGTVALDKYRSASGNWQTSSQAADSAYASPFGSHKLSCLLVDASFAGAVVFLQGEMSRTSPENAYKRHGSTAGGPTESAPVTTSLRAPGIALKVEYIGDGPHSKEPTLNGEMRVEASSNTVYPEMVPIILQISDSVKEMVRENDAREKSLNVPKITSQAPQKPASRLLDNETLASNPLLTRTRLSLGLRICKQEFGLSCQPIARVNAMVQIEDIYVTMNTMDQSPQGRFLAVSAALTRFGASVQHVYSRESTFNFDVESVVLSVMNSKHLGGGSSGLSAILKFNPMTMSINARQLQDVLLFQEIWMPRELRRERSATAASPMTEQNEFLVQKYRQVATAAAFPWNATVAMDNLIVELDLGQSIGKTSFNIQNLWAASTKSSGWKQDLCVGVDNILAKSAGRMGGFIELSQLEVRTSIEWPSQDLATQQAPLIQATLGFERLRVKAAFDYQPFAFADIEAFSFLMYNVREQDHSKSDRLVAVLDGGKVFAFCTATSPAQAVGLFQAFDRLLQEKQAAYSQSVHDLEKQLQRQSISQTYPIQTLKPTTPSARPESSKFPISLRTDLVVVLRSLSVGAFPGTFFDSQILKMEASDVNARFQVGLADTKIYSNLSMTLGQLGVALAAVKRIKVPKTLGDISVDEVISSASAAKGGGILRVPRVVASMQTWQIPEGKQIEYVFKSLFEGKVDVGWNYSRISFIRSMWETHSRSLAARLGKALPESAVKITAGPDQSSSHDDAKEQQHGEQGKITAVVNMPLSKYEYKALEPPVIETPQLRDMGEATPPLEWIGLQRDRLPHVVHQVVIVALLEVAKEVEDAYGQILGAS